MARPDYGLAAADLGLGAGGMGQSLSQQLETETEEQRRKRLLQQREQAMSPAAQMLLPGGIGGGAY
jgi:hypothetical protein